MKLKNKCESFSFFGFLILIVLGSLWHFAFDFFDKNTLIGAFAPVNESVWEHLKLILFPAVPITAMEYFMYGRSHDGFFAARSISAIIGMLFIVMGFYTYVGIVGNNSFIADITLFIIGAALSSFLPSYLMKNNSLKERDSIIWLTVITALTILFIYFTFNPPMIELFRDPVTDDFGLVASYID